MPPRWEVVCAPDVSRVLAGYASNGRHLNHYLLAFLQRIAHPSDGLDLEPMLYQVRSLCTSVPLSVPSTDRFQLGILSSIESIDHQSIALYESNFKRTKCMDEWCKIHELCTVLTTKRVRADSPFAAVCV